MATKTQKRQARKHKEEVKEATARMKNLSEDSIHQLENYATFQILYINDAAYQRCMMLGNILKDIPYKTKAVNTIYNALMKRWYAYNEFVKSTGINMDSVYALFGEIDEYIDERIAKFKKAIEQTLSDSGVDNAMWISHVETALTICDYAEQVSRDIIERLVGISPRATFLIPLIIKEPARVMGNLADVVQKIHVKVEIDLNTIPEIQTAFRQLNKAFLDPKNFKKAQEKADVENIAEGRMTIM